MGADPIRVLQVIGSMSCGGAEMLLMNLHRHINRNIVQFDYVVHTKDECFYDKEIHELGGKIYHCPKFNGTNIVRYLVWWKHFYNKHQEYKIVHGHIGSSAAIYLSISRLYGAYTIAHSHNTANPDRSLRALMWNMFSYPTRFVANYYMACSIEAGLDRFGKKVVSSGNFSVLKNAIDCNRFKFRQEVREKKRDELCVSDNYVVGHIGRFTDQKNHLFLLEIFFELKKIDPTAKLLLLGEGSLQSMVQERCINMNLEDDVIFAGIHRDTERYYMAMDVFCLPSKYEGLSIVTVEAQTSGLNVLVSEGVPNLADIKAGLFSKMDLKLPPKQWASALIDKKKNMHNRDAVDEAKNAGFDINVEVNQLQRFYIDHWSSIQRKA